MTKSEAITELVRIWHSPHLDLILKARLGEVIEALKENDRSDSLVTDSSDDCKKSKSKLDLISRQDALCILKKKMIDRPLDSDRWVIRDITVEIKLLPSAELRKITQESTQDLISRQDAIDAIMGEPTDAHYPSWYAQRIKLLPSAEPKTGEWIFNTNTSNGKSWNVCSECGESMFHPANFCPNCGARMIPYKGGDSE